MRLPSLESAMRLAIMQPYFFPYLGYFSLIAASDQFVIFDEVQFIRHGWINRNRILKPCHSAEQYIIVPLVKHHRCTPIRDVQIANHLPWQDKIIRQLDHYRSVAPYFAEVMNLLEDCFGCNTDSISQLNQHILEKVCNWIGLPFHKVLMSEVSLTDVTIRHPGDWALEIATKLKATHYINPHAGRSIFDATAFESRNIQLQFLRNRLNQYSQTDQPFISSLSILDALLFVGPAMTRQLVMNFERIDSPSVHGFPVSSIPSPNWATEQSIGQSE